MLHIYQQAYSHETLFLATFFFGPTKLRLNLARNVLFRETLPGFFVNVTLSLRLVFETGVKTRRLRNTIETKAI